MKIYKRQFNEMAYEDFSIHEWSRYTIIFKRYVTKYKSLYTTLLTMMKNASKIEGGQDKFIQEYATKISPRLFLDHKVLSPKEYAYIDKDLIDLQNFLIHVTKTELTSYNKLTIACKFLSSEFNNSFPLINLLVLTTQIQKNPNPILCISLKSALEMELKYLEEINSLFNKIDRVMKEYLNKKILFVSERPEELKTYKGLKYTIRRSKKITKEEEEYIPELIKHIDTFIDRLQKLNLLKHMIKKCDKVVIGDAYALLKTSGDEGRKTYYAYYTPSQHTIYLPIDDSFNHFYEHAFFHEAGHLFLNYLKENKGSKGKALYDIWNEDFNSEWEKKHAGNILPSAYAYTDFQEAFAEMFAFNYSNFFREGTTPSPHIQNLFLKCIDVIVK